MFALVGCGENAPADDTDPAAPPVLEEFSREDPGGYEDQHGNIDAETREAGRLVYDEFCMTCHERGVNRAPQREMLILMTPESIYRALTEGVMQPEAQDLTDEQKQHVASFLSDRKLGGADLPPQLMCEGEAAEFDTSQPPVFTGWGLSPTSNHFISTEVAGIDRANVGQLKLKWAHGYPNAIRARSQPALAAGAIFVGSHNGTVYALDRETGCARWMFTASAEVRTGIVISPWDAEDSNPAATVYFGDLIGHVYAVDAFTGELKWRLKMDPHPNVTVTAAPALHDGTLYVSVSSLEVSAAIDPTYSCCTFRGAVVALDAQTGDEKWRTYTIAEEPAPQGENSVGAEQFGPSGAPIWNSPAIDIARNQLYVGTGENYSSPATLTSDAIFAIDLTTGKVNWTFQATPGDAWNSACEIGTKENCPEENGPDFDFGSGSVLATDSDGRGYVLAGQKSGMQHALDPDTGEVIWQQKVGRGGVRAGIHFGIATSGDTVFAPVSDLPDEGLEGPDQTPRPGMYALDIKTGDYRWQSPAEDTCGERKFCNPGHSGAISATPDLVLAGSMDGYIRIYDATSGKILWKYSALRDFDTVNGIPAQGGSMGGGTAPIAHDGMLIVNAGYGFAGLMPGNVLLVFEVDRDGP